VAELFVPERLDDAVAFLAEHAGRAFPVAGGTDMMIDTRVGRVRAEWLVDVTRLHELEGLGFEGETLRIGALTRIRALELDRELFARASAVVEAARVLGSVQIRNMATVGGNICHATPSAEMPPALLVHDAVAEVVGREGARSLPLAEVFAGPGQTTLTPDELLTAVVLRAPSSGVGSCYVRQTVRWSMDLAGVGVAASVEVEGQSVTQARIALGAVAPVPLLVDAAADAVIGTDLPPEAAERAGGLAAAASVPISDARGTAEYRRQVVGVLVPRALRIAWLRATGSWPDGVPARANGVLTEDGR
jgi:aerobic carbon-monoxide dehydrogenase medium subunit